METSRLNAKSSDVEASSVALYTALCSYRTVRIASALCNPRALGSSQTDVYANMEHKLEQFCLDARRNLSRGLARSQAAFE